MSTRTEKRLNGVYAMAERLAFGDGDRLVLMSDCHRGDGSQADNFLHNQTLYTAALAQYAREGYTYIELGDGDELWENTAVCDIADAHRGVFDRLAQLHTDGRLYMLYGNHDLCKRGENFGKAITACSYDNCRCRVPLFPALRAQEGLVLCHADSGGELLLVHGHQADVFNDRFWRVGQWLVRHLWRPLELIGVRDPTSAAKNYRKKGAVERRLSRWADTHPPLLIAGHTHRPMLPAPGEGRYFNDGSAVHPSGVAALEIAGGEVRLVKWHYQIRDGGAVYAGRETLAGPHPLRAYFSS